MRIGHLGYESAPASLPNAALVVPTPDLLTVTPDFTAEIGPESSTAASDRTPRIDSARVIP
jgi:hypothetical protein